MMSASEVVTEIAELAAPWGRRIKVSEIAYESGLKMMRLRIREGTRFTIVELDAPTATELGAVLLAWVKKNDAAPH
jgi:hypothetical protein